MEQKDEMLIKKRSNHLWRNEEVLYIFIKGCVPVHSSTRDTGVNKNKVPNLCVDCILGVEYLRKRYRILYSDNKKRMTNV